MANEIDADALAAHFAEQDKKANAVSGVSIAVKAGAQFSPEEWAKSSQLSLSTGVDPSALASNPLIRAAAENRLKGEALNVPDLVDTHPKVAQWMTDPVNAGITGENHGLLQGVSDAFDQLGASAFSGTVNLVAAGAKLLQSGLEMVGVGTSDAEVATLYKNDPEGLKRFREKSLAGGLSRFARGAQKFSTEAFDLRDPATKAKYDPLKYATTKADESALLSPIKIMGDALRSLPTSVAMGATILFTRNVAITARAQATAQATTLGLTGEAAGAFVAKAVTAAAAKAAAASGAVSEGAAGYATQSLSTEEEAAKMDMSKSTRYAQLIKDGYAPEAAKAKVVADVAEQAGVIAGIADAAVNAAAGRLLGGILTGAGGAIKSGAKTAALEGATEAVQSPLEQLGTNIGLAEIDPSKSLSDGLLESALQGLAVGAASGGTLGGLHGLTNKGIADDTKVRKALANHDALTALSEAATKAAPVRDLDKGRFKAFMESMVEDSDVKELFVDANALHDALAQAPIEAQQMFMQEMPEVIAQFGEGTVTDGFVRIPVADYAAHIAGTEIDATILPQLKTDLDGLTYSQAEQQMQEQQTNMQKTADDLVAKHAEDAAYQADVQGVYDNILGQLEAAKRFRPDVNKKYAELQKAYFVVAAEEEGVSPSEMLRRFPLKIVGGDTLGDTATTLEQEEVSKAKIAGFDTDKVWLHGTTKDFASFKVRDGGVNELGKGVYLSSNPDETYFHSRGEGGRTLSLFVKKGDVFDYSLLRDTGQQVGGTTRADLVQATYNNIARRVQRNAASLPETVKGWATVPVGELAERIKSTGIDSLNTWLDRAGFIGAKDITSQYPDQLVVFDPKNIRSINAKFNPNKADSANLLAQASSDYGYRARDAARKATLEDFTPGKVKDLLRKTDWAILTAENPAAQQLAPEENAARMEELKADLAAQGIQFEVVEGKYGGNIENRVVLVGVTQAQASAIGQKFGQESVLTRAGLVYPDGTINPAKKVNTYEKAPDDFYTRVPSTGALFSVDIDFDAKLTPTGERVGEIEIDAVHFSREARSTLSGRAYSTGIRGAEAKRLADSKDSRIKSRISFHVDEGKGVFPEGGVGAFKHEMTLTNMYDGAKNPLKLDASDSNTFETAVLDAGFDGYYVREGFGRQGAAVLLGQAADSVQIDLPESQALKQADPLYNRALVTAREKGSTSISAMVRTLGVSWARAESLIKQLEVDGYLTPAVERTTRDGFESKRPIVGQYDVTDKINTAELLYQSGVNSDMFASDFADKDTTVTRDVVVSSKGTTEKQTFGNVNSKGQKITGTKQGLNNFLNWFGDSTAVDAKGLPLVLYHGTDKDITAFEAGRESINSNSLGSSWITRRNGIFFTDNVAFAETFATLTKERRANGANILPVYLKMEQPLDFVKGLSQFDEDALAAAGYNTRMLHQAGTLPWELFDDEEGEALTAAMRKAGYDSAVFEEEDDNGEMQKAYVVLDPQQIKSASGNLGTFDPDTTSVLYQSSTDEMLTPKPLWFSALAKGVEAASEKAFSSGEQVSKWLDANKGKLGIKDDEIYWSGVKDWLATQDKVSKADVLAYLSGNGARVEEVTLTNRAGGYGTKFASYQLPGGESYKELLLTLPSKESPRAAELRGMDDRTLDEQFELNKLEKPSGAFKSSHFDQPNILAHIRFNERTDAEGNRVLFLEEIQSDWGQKGKKEGFGPQQRWEVTLGNGDVAYYQTEERANQAAKAGGGFVSYTPIETKGIPTAPFVTDTKSWTALALKRMVRYAADNGFDKIAWTTGEQQAERYDLSKQVERIEIRKGTDNTYQVRAFTERTSNQAIDESNVQISRVEELVGKDLAKKAEEQRVGFVEKYSGEQLKVGGEGMKGFYDQIVPQVANDILKKVGGGKVENVGVNANPSFDRTSKDLIVRINKTSDGRYRAVAGAGEERIAKTFDTDAEAQTWAEQVELARTKPTSAQQGFTLTPEMKTKVQEGQALFQPNRGSFSPNTLTTSLLKDADLSTFLHESGHAFLEMDMARASAPDAPQRVKERMAETLRWFGVADINVWNGMTLEQKRPYHEKFARGFEAYLLEGKAPSTGLQSVFASFRSWLLHIYRNILNLNVELTPEVRQVFDRMLATDDQIAAAEEARNYGKLAIEGLSGAYDEQDKKATADSIETLQARSMRDMKWLSNAKARVLKELQVQADSKRRAIKVEVTAEVMAEPINQARTWLRKGEMVDSVTGEQVKADKGFRLDNAELATMYPETMLSRPDLTALRGMTMNNGLPPDVVADMFGFRSGDQLVRELINGEDAKTKIDGLTDVRMLEEHGDLVDPRAVEEAANRAVHNEARARFIATGLKALTNSPLSSFQLAKAATATAKEVIAAKKVRDLHPAQYTAAESKANREALKEVAKDPAKAQRAQRSALLNNRLAAASLDALEEVRKGVDHLNKVQKKAAQSSMRGEYLTQLNALLDRFDLRSSATLKSLDIQRTPFAEWIQSEAERLSAVVPDIAGWIQNESNATHYKNLTVEEFRGVVEAVKSLELMARREEKQYQAIRGMKFVEERTAILDRIREFHPEAFSLDGEPLGMSPKFVKHLGDTVESIGEKAAAEFLNAETIISLLEGGEFGVVSESLFGRMSNRADWKAQRLNHIQEQLKPLFEAYSMKERYNFGRKDIAADIGMSLTRENALVVLLLHGNAEGRERLSNYGWSLTTQQAIVNLLDAKDIELAKGIWHLFDQQLWPELRELNDRTRGKSPPKVEALPVWTNHGEVSGGYFRLKYDSNLDERAHRLDEGAAVKELLGGGMGMSAKTAQGSSTERKANVTMRPRLDLGVFAEAVTETVHDLAFREAVADTMRMLNDVKVQNTIKTAAGTPAYRALVNRVREIAAPPRNPAGFIEKTLSIARRNTIITLMSGVGTALQNFTGLATAFSGNRIAPGRLAKEIGLFYSPKMAERYQFAMDNSDYMKGRNQSFERDLQRQIKGLTVKADIMPEMGTWLVLMGLVDKGTSAPVWNAAFDEGMARFENDRKKAVDYADHTVRQTLGSGREIDISQIMGGHGGWGQLKKTFTMFQSYFNGQLGQLVRSGAINKRLAQTNPGLATARFTRDFMLVYVIPMVLTKMLFAPPDKDPEEWERNYARAFVQYGTAMIPLWGSMMNSLWAAFDPTARNYGYKITPVESGVEGVIKGIKSAAEVAAGEGDDKDFKNIIMGTGFVVGLPGKLVSDTALGTKAFLEEEAGPMAIIQGPPRK